MNDKFCDSLDEDDCCAAFNNTIRDISTELDSEDASSHGNIFPTKKKLFLHDFLIINQENIYKTQIQVYKDFCSKIQMKEKFKSVLSYIINRCENKKNVGKTVICKLLYF